MGGGRREGGVEGPQVSRPFSEPGHILKHWDANVNRRRPLPSKNLSFNLKKKRQPSRKGEKGMNRQLTASETALSLHAEKMFDFTNNQGNET